MDEDVCQPDILLANRSAYLPLHSLSYATFALSRSFTLAVKTRVTEQGRHSRTFTTTRDCGSFTTWALVSTLPRAIRFRQSPPDLLPSSTSPIHLYGLRPSSDTTKASGPRRHLLYPLYPQCRPIPFISYRLLRLQITQTPRTHVRRNVHDPQFSSPKFWRVFIHASVNRRYQHPPLRHRLVT